MKKILYIFPTVSAGGAEKAAILTANYLVEKHSYEITFFVYDDSYQYLSLINKGITVIQYGRAIRKSLQSWHYYVDFGIRLFLAVRADDYDVIVSIHEQVPEAAASWLWILNLLKGRNIRRRMVSVIQLSLRGIGEERRHASSRMIMFFLSVLRRFVFGTVVVLSEHIAPSLAGYPGKTHVIPNPIDFRSILKSVGEAGRTHAQPYIVSVARFTAQKNPLLLLRAYGIVSERVHYDLLMIGRVADRALFEEMNQFIRGRGLEGRVRLLDPVENPYPLIKHAKAMILTSNYEGIPLALLEAMALKVPVITTTYDGYASCFNPENAMLVERNSAESVAAMLCALEADPVPFEQKAEQAFLDSRKYDIAVVGERYHDVFKNIQW